MLPGGSCFPSMPHRCSSRQSTLATAKGEGAPQYFRISHRRVLLAPTDLLTFHEIRNSGRPRRQSLARDKSPKRHRQEPPMPQQPVSQHRQASKCVGSHRQKRQGKAPSRLGTAAVDFREAVEAVGPTSKKLRAGLHKLAELRALGEANFDHRTRSRSQRRCALHPAADASPGPMFQASRTARATPAISG